MGEISRYDVLTSFGFGRNPFGARLFETADMARIRRVIKMAVADRGLVSVVGERGAGKSIAVMKALEATGCKVCKVWSVDKKRLLISDIEYAIIHGLSQEPPKRMKEIRSLQLRRILGDSAKSRSIAVVIEEAHHLHHSTLRAIKALRELAWMGRANLFAVVLIGQSDATGKPGLAEIRLRADSVHMAGMSADEAVRYIAESLGDAVADDAARALAATAEARNYLDLQSLCIRSMAAAMAEGRNSVTAEDVGFVTGAAERKPERAPAPKSSGLGKVLARRQEQDGNERMAM